MSVADVFLQITGALTAAGIPYMLAGSFASTYYGAPRSTRDIDLVIEATREQLTDFVQQLASENYYAELSAALDALRQESMFNVIDMASGWKIDLIIRKPRAFSREEFGRRQLVTLQDLSLFVASAEDVIISKLEWSKLSQSQRQIEDVSAILRIRGQALDQEYLAKWIAELQLESEWRDAQRAANL
ncbi:MAG: hypothetical protein WAN03_20965 [Candidatus Sulfotelmatobacter sp.]